MFEMYYDLSLEYIYGTELVYKNQEYRVTNKGIMTVPLILVIEFVITI